MGKVVTKAGKEIDRKSAGNIKRPREEQKADEEPENEFGYTDSKCMSQITQTTVARKTVAILNY